MGQSHWMYEETEALRVLLRQRLGVRANDFPTALRRAGRQLPAPVRKAGQRLVQALPMADHPKLEQTLDRPGLEGAANEIRAFLEEVDVADRRMGALLGILGSIAFSLVMVFALVIVLMVWRGLI